METVVKYEPPTSRHQDDSFYEYSAQFMSGGTKITFQIFLIRAAPFVMNNEGLWDKKYDNLYFINT